ncbi:MAG: ABC transporter substrate-binding protein [Deltaproteobacteria bacterium]|nr:ABC transporter substrate-binding protein [Deltaproteobacteria bacterium]
MKKIALLCLCLGMGLAVAAAPAGAAEVRGVTADTIKIGQWGPQTGPAALWGAVARGTGIYFKMLNDDGGINGRKFDYYLRDDGYQPNRTKAIVKELVDSVGVFGFVGGVGTAPGMAAMPLLVEKNVPWVGMTTGSTHWAYPPKKTVFALYPLYKDEAQILTRYALDTLGKKKLAFLYQNDDYGKGGLEGAQKEMAARNMKLTAEVPCEVTDTDLQSHILKLKESGADCVIMWLLPKQAVISIGTAAKLGYKPQWMACSTLSDTALMFKISKGLWKGVMYGNFALPPDSDNPLMVKYHEAQKKYAPQENWGVFLYAGFGFAEPMVEGLKRAGKDLTVDSFVAAMETLKDFQGIMGKISFGPDQRQGMRQVFLGTCDDKGKVKRLSDWLSAE